MGDGPAFGGRRTGPWWGASAAKGGSCGAWRCMLPAGSEQARGCESSDSRSSPTRLRPAPSRPVAVCGARWPRFGLRLAAQSSVRTYADSHGPARSPLALLPRAPLCLSGVCVLRLCFFSIVCARAFRFCVPASRFTYSADRRRAAEEGSRAPGTCPARQRRQKAGG